MMLSGLNKFKEIVSPYISDTFSKRMNSWDLLLVKNHNSRARILDFGCGDGSSLNFKELYKKGNLTPL